VIFAKHAKRQCAQCETAQTSYCVKEKTTSDQFKINGQTLEVPRILDLMPRQWIGHTTLCHHKDLTLRGLRLCLVDISRHAPCRPRLHHACLAGMVVQPKPRADPVSPRTILELRWSGFTPGYTMMAQPNSNWIPSRALGALYDIDMKKCHGKEPFRQIDSDPNPFIWLDKNKCISGTRGVRACAEVQGTFCLDFRPTG